LFPTSGSPAYFLTSSITIGVPTITLVPVSTIPEVSLINFPFTETVYSPITQ